MKNIKFAMNSFKKNFIRCGLTGWAVEIFFTCFHSMTSSVNRQLMGQTSLLMFPIYGLGAFIPVLARRLKNMKFWIRGNIYALFIFLTEYLSGSLLRHFHACPWDYSQSRYHINGLIRLDFFPFWFLLGLLFERLTLKQNS